MFTQVAVALRRRLVVSFPRSGATPAVSEFCASDRQPCSRGTALFDLADAYGRQFS